MCMQIIGERSGTMVVEDLADALKTKLHSFRSRVKAATSDYKISMSASDHEEIEQRSKDMCR